MRGRAVVVVGDGGLTVLQFLHSIPVQVCFIDLVNFTSIT